MGSSNKTRRELVEEVRTLRSRLAELEHSAAVHPHGEAPSDISELRQAQVALQNSESRYDTLVKANPHGVQETDTSGTITFANPAYLEMLGYTAQELLGKSVLELLEPPSKRDELRAYLSALVREQPKPTTRFQKNRTKDGRIIDMEVDWAYRRDHAGQVIGFTFVITDVTERRKTGQLLKIKEAAIASSMSGMALTDAQGRLVYVNDCAVSMWGYKHADEILGRCLWEFWEGDGIFQTIKALREKGGRIGEGIGKRKDGSLFTAQYSASMIKDEAGEPLCMFGSFLDITEHKRMQDSLRESEEKFRIITEQSFDAIFTADLDGTLTYASPAVTAIFGYRPDEMIGRKAMEFVSESDVADTAQQLEETAAGAIIKGQHLRILRKDGTIGIMEISSCPVRQEGKIVGAQASARDITEQQRVERRFRSLVEQTSDAVFCYEYDPPIATSLPIADQVKRLYAGVLVECNDVCAQSYGARTAAEVIGRPLLELYRAEPGSLDCLYEKLIRNGYRTTDEEGVEVRADGTKRYYLNNGHGVVENGQLVRVWGTFRDITARKEAERALEAEKGFTETALDALKDTFFVFDPKTGKAIRWNKAFSEVSEYSNDEIRSMKAPDSYYSRDDQEKAAAAAENLNGAETVTVELSLITKSGKTIPTEYVGSALRDGQGDLQYIISIGRDITDRKEAEERAHRHQAELVHMARLSTIGQMASELAHELNQPLCATLAHLEGCLGIARLDTSNRDRLIQKLDKATRQVDRASHIVSRVKGFAKMGKGKRSTVVINQVVQEAVDFVATELRHNHVAVAFSLSESLPPLQADPIQIEQVVLNLIHNAIDAMAATPKGQRQLILKTSRIAESVEVALSDTGNGVSSADAERIFEPFVTTKPEGLGVGLSISRSIVEAHGGGIYFRNNADRGATFCITLPLKARQT